MDELVRTFSSPFYQTIYAVIAIALTAIGVIVTIYTSKKSDGNIKGKRLGEEFVSQSEIKKNQKELISEIKKSDITRDQKNDIITFLIERRNLMKPKELAAKQLEAQKICVIAHTPLETCDKGVMDSSKHWLRAAQNKKNASFEFWIPHSKKRSAEVFSVVSSLLSEVFFEGAEKIFSFVFVPDDMMSVDFTLWDFGNGSITAFVNDYDVFDRDYRLWELKSKSALRLNGKLASIRAYGIPEEVKVSTPHAPKGETTISALFVPNIPPISKTQK